MPKHYHIVFNLLVLTTAIYIGVDIFYRIVRIQLWQVDDAQEVEIQHDNGRKEEQTRSADAYQAVIDRNIFGSQELQGQAVKVEEIIHLEPTSLQVSLLGTIAGDQQSARAIIKDNQKHIQNLYRVGDSIEGAVIKQILRGKVVLRFRGRDEILSMEESPETSKQEGRSSTQASRKSRRRLKTASRQSTFSLSRQEIHGALENISDILSQVRVQPYMKNGRSEGLIVSEISPDSFFERMGLNDGDIVQAVNNKRIKSPEDVIALYQSLKFGSRINLQVIRNDQQKVLNYNIR